MSGIYKSEYSKQLLNSINTEANIANKYELASGCEKEFNNAARFLKYAVLKDSALIDENENEYSDFFGKMLEKYNDLFLTNDDIARLIEKINNYNNHIDDMYNKNVIVENLGQPDNEGVIALPNEGFGEDSELKNIISDIFGLHIDTFTIDQYTLAEKFYNAIKQYYLNYFGKFTPVFTKVSSAEISNGGDFYTKTDDTYTAVNNPVIYYEENESNELIPTSDIEKISDKIYYVHTTGNNYDELDENVDFVTYYKMYTAENLTYYYKREIKVYNDGINITPKIFNVYEDSNQESFPELYYINDSITVSFGEYEDLFIKLVIDILLTKVFGRRNCCYGNISLSKTIKDVVNTENIDSSNDNILNQQYNIYQNVGVTSINAEYENIVVGRAKDIFLTTIAYDQIQHNEYYVVKTDENDDTDNHFELVTDLNGRQKYSKAYAGIYGTSSNYLLIKLLEGSTNLFANSLLKLHANNINNIIISIGDSNVELDLNIVDYVDITNELFNLDNETYFDMFYDMAINAVRFILQIPENIILANNEFNLNENDTGESFIYNNFLLPEYERISKYREKIIASVVMGEDLESKRSASSIETARLISYKNIAFFKLNNIKIENGDDIYNNLTILNNNTPVFDSSTGCVNITILYKELNPIIRDILSSSILETVISEILTKKEVKYTSTNELIDKEINDILYEEIYRTPTNAVNYYSTFNTDNNNPNEIYRFFYTLKTNPYLVRKQNVNSIIAFYSGMYFGYGDNVSENDEINTILTLFAEVRDYFYRVLYSNAFAKTDLYDLFIKFYIKAYTIERFMTSKIDNLQNIDKYSLEDCKNFFISYGLKALYDQIEKASFANAVSYCRRLISKYTELMSKKGSRAVIDEFIKIFDINSTNIDLFKYLLVNTNNDGNINNNTLEFVRVPYSTENITYSIDANKNNVTAYADFIESDKYWNIEDVPENTAKSVVRAPVTTKYLGVKLTKQIYEDYVKSKYALSTMYEIFNAISNLPNVGGNILNNFKKVIDNNKQVSLLQLYLRVCLLFDKYIDIQNANFPGILPEQTEKHYYRINLDNITNGLKDFILDNKLADIMTTPILVKSGSGIEITNNFYYFIKSINQLPFKYTNSDRYSERSILPLLDTNITFPLSNNILSTDEITYKPYIEYCVRFNNASVNNREIPIYSESSDNILPKYNSVSLLDDALSALSVLNVFSYGTADVDWYEDLFTAMIYFEGYKNNDGSYPISNNLVNDLQINTFFYNAIFKRIFDFPVKYLLGEYKHSNIELTQKISKLLDDAFEKFFISETELADDEDIKNAAIGTDPNDYDFAEITAMLDQYATIPAEEYSNKIIEYIGYINEITTSYDDMAIHIDFLEDINNMMEFIKISIQNFISYTSMLYKSELSYNISTSNEQSNILDAVSDKIKNSGLEEFCYVDETITIRDITEEE